MVQEIIKQRVMIDSRKIFARCGLAAIFLVGLSSSAICSERVDSDPPRITNVHFALGYGGVLINYDLIGVLDAQYSVQVELRNANDSSYVYFPRAVAGDVGVGKFAGTNRKILWSIRQEFPLGLPDSSYYFVVNVQPVQETYAHNTYYLIGAGAAVLAAATTYLLVSGAHSKPAQVLALPAPPGRP